MSAKRDYHAERLRRLYRLQAGQRLVDRLVQLRTLDETALLMGCSAAYVKFLEQQALWKVQMRLRALCDPSLTPHAAPVKLAHV